MQSPKTMPTLPSLEALSEASNKELVFRDWELQCSRTSFKNSELFEKHLRIMKLCSLLNGALGRSVSNHFSWCPHELWESYWSAQGWPKLPEIDRVS